MDGEGIYKGDIPKETTVKQRQGKTYKIILAIVLSAAIAISSIVLYHHITFDPYMGVKPDMGTMWDEDRPAEGSCSYMPLGNTEFVASLSVFCYTDEDDKDWDYCTIEVSREIGDTYYVFFERQLDMAGNMLPLREAGVVTFDEDSGIVTFKVGEKTFIYKLPER